MRFLVKRRALTQLNKTLARPSAYLDNFLIIADTKVECQQAYEEWIKLLGELGFQFN